MHSTDHPACSDLLDRQLREQDRIEEDGLYDEFDEWENAGRYLPHTLYPTLRKDDRG